MSRRVIRTRWGALFRNVSYASTNSRQVLDVWLPRATAMPAGGWRAVFAVHGGGWWQGDKTDWTTHELFAPTLDAGIAWIAPNYRLSTTHAWPTHIYDCKAALRYVRANAGKFCLNNGRIGGLGASAGAHIAACMALTPGVAALRDASLGYGSTSEALAACLSWYAPTQAKSVDTDFTAQVAISGGAANGRGFAVCSTSSQEARMLGSDASPANPCSAADAVRDLADVPYWCANGTDIPPMRIQHGEKLDAVVPVGQAQRFRTALEARGRVFSAGTQYHYEEVAGAGHGNSPWAASGVVDPAVAWLATYL